MTVFGYTIGVVSNAVLIVSPFEKTRASLASMLGGGRGVCQAATPDEAIALLERHDIPVVIADGRWRECLEFAATRPNVPSVIVTSPLADEALWAEVLNLGGYDVLAQPFDANEVTRIAQAALRRAKMPNYHRSQIASLAAGLA